MTAKWLEIEWTQKKKKKVQGDQQYHHHKYQGQLKHMQYQDEWGLKIVVIMTATWLEIE
jgi:hypothetical protein